jgi:phenylacetate-CoA ligase
MKSVPLTPLEGWIKGKVGLQAHDRLTRETITRYQLVKIRETLDYVRANSPFYRRLLSGWPEAPTRELADLASLPMTTAEDLCEHHLQMLCVSHSDIARVVTLQVPKRKPRRLYFTESDMDLTVDFFHHGMSGLVKPGQRVLILMPGRQLGSVGDLLSRGLARMGVEGIVHGLVEDAERTIEEILTRRIDCLVGIPTQVLTLSRHETAAAISRGRIKSVLLSADHVPNVIADELRKVWDCQVYEHYGMTEMGLGGGVQCSSLSGYHMREADFFFEIVDPKTGRPVPEGETGEVVFTTLTRQAMPLIRYRTGDLARFIPQPCACGSVLKRMDKIQGRLKDMVNLGSLHELTVSVLDEVIFKVAEVLNYQIEIYRSRGKGHIRLTIHLKSNASSEAKERVEAALEDIPAIREAIEEEAIMIDPIKASPVNWPTTGSVKRQIIDRRR